MRDLFHSIGKLIFIIVDNICDFIKSFCESASDKCKWYTFLAFVISVLFLGIDMYEYNLNSNAEESIQETANKVFDPLLKQIDDMDEQSKTIMEPIGEAVTELKPQWIKLGLFAASLIIGVFINFIKNPLEKMKDILSDEINEEKSQPMMWVPFGIFMCLDVFQLFSSFT